MINKFVGIWISFVALVLLSIAFGLGWSVGAHSSDETRKADAERIDGFRTSIRVFTKANRELAEEADALRQELAPYRQQNAEISNARASMPPEILAELIDQPTLSFGATGFSDPHDDPAWHHFRRDFAKQHCCCMVTGCQDDPRGDAIHHGIAAAACTKAGHYELAVGEGPGQSFWRLCEKHHAEIGHGIGHGGSWHKFNLDIAADVKAGRWNSRGKSEWGFATDDELVAWVKERANSK